MRRIALVSAANRLRFILAAALLAALAAPAAPAQSATLARAEVAGSQHYSPEQVLAAAGLALGQQVTRDDLQAAADRLARLGFFRDVRYRFSSLGDDLALTFELEEAPLVPVWFDNFPWFTDEELHAALAEAVPLYRGVAPEFGIVLDQFDAALRELLAAHDVAAEIEHDLVARPGTDELVQRFRVVGRSLRVEGIEFTDPLAAENPRIREFLAELVGRPFSRHAVEVFLFDHVRPLYLARGHLRVEFGRPRARFTGDPRQPLADQVLVVVPVEPGPVYRWNGAEWTGNAAFGPRPLNELLGMRQGAPADGRALIAAWERIRQEYRRRGFLDIELEAEPEFDDAQQMVRYRVRLREGPQYRMGQLVITGLSLAAERLLTAAWRIPPGEIFDQVWFEDFLERGLRPAFGDHIVHYQQVGHLLRKHPEGRTVDVLMDFK